MAAVDFEVSKELAESVYDTLEAVRNSGVIKKGVNETTKSVERGLAKLVVIAEDVSPPEIVMHLPALCREKNVPYVGVPSKQELGKSVGLEVATSSVAIQDAGKAKREMENILKQIKNVKK